MQSAEKLEKVENELKTTLSPADFQKVNQIINRAAEGIFTRSRETTEEAGTSETRAEERSESEARALSE